MVEKTNPVQLKWKLLWGGFCTQRERLAITDGKWKKRIFPALFSLILHPQRGPILFDTGYARHFLQVTKKFPYRIYPLITPVSIQPEEEAKAQIKALGFQPEEIDTIILSHLHVDHIAGVKDFPQATFICTKKSYDAIKGKRGLAAISSGFVPGLLPDDFAARCSWVEERMQVELSSAYAPFTRGYDLFADGSMIAVDLPGHAAGQIGLFFTDDQGRRIFLAADACWLSRNYKERLAPHPAAHILSDDRQALHQTLQKVHQLYQNHPDIWIIPSHCTDAWERVQKDRQKKKGGESHEPASDPAGILCTDTLSEPISRA